MRMAKVGKKAWHQSHILHFASTLGLEYIKGGEKSERDVDKMLVILPFEKEFYHKHGVEVEYVGHPLAERLTKLDTK